MTTRPTAARQLATRIRRFISDPLADRFESLALDIHRWQAQSDTVVAALTTETPQSWLDIPAVPVDLFKRLSVGTVDPRLAKVVFRTSGTSAGIRGVHRLHDTDLYDAGSLRWAESCLGTLPTDVAALLMDPRLDPTSSLGHMVSRFAPDENTTWHLKPDSVDYAGLNHRIKDLDGPLFVATTAFAAVGWLQFGARPLPAGSTLMVTGGFKGRIHNVSGDELYLRAARELTENIVTEYGMTELSSQLWGTPTQPFRPPHWLRVLAVDPITGEPKAVGEVGQLRFVDLCNLDSTVAIDSLDQGLVDERGNLTLYGRLPGAPARGCSLTIEDRWMEAAR